MQGLTEPTKKVFEQISNLNSVKDYFLIGGTAIAIQINHRLSEDLDFCKWKSSGEKVEVNWPAIEHELLSKFEIEKKDILGLDQVNFIFNDVKMTFYANNLYRNPIKQVGLKINNIQIPDLPSLGAMKLEVMLRRSKFRDYYDIYSLLMNGLSLKTLIDESIKYSNHQIKRKHIVSYISNSKNFIKEKNFDILVPKYQVNSIDIEKFVKEKIAFEYSL
jgi:hypothetical protein